MEEKNCCERLSQTVFPASAGFFLQHCSRDSLQARFLPVDMAELKKRKAPVSATVSMAIRMVFLLLMAIDFFI